jgi:hypothetical protein
MPNNKSDEPYVILVRHASRERRWDKPEDEHAMENWTSWTTASIQGKSDFKTKSLRG